MSWYLKSGAAVTSALISMAVLCLVSRCHCTYSFSSSLRVSQTSDKHGINLDRFTNPTAPVLHLWVWSFLTPYFETLCRWDVATEVDLPHPGLQFFSGSASASPPCISPSGQWGQQHGRGCPPLCLHSPLLRNHQLWVLSLSNQPGVCAAFSDIVQVQPTPRREGPAKWAAWFPQGKALVYICVEFHNTCIHWPLSCPVQIY